MRDWTNERYVRLCTRKTVNWQMLTMEAQGLLVQLLMIVDRAGVLEIGKHGAKGIAAAIGHPTRWADLERPLAELLEDGCLVRVADTLFVPNFLAAQEALLSDAQRQRDSRERRAAKMRAELLGLVTARDEMSHGVTPEPPEPGPPGGTKTQENGKTVTRRDIGSRDVTKPSRGVTRRHSNQALVGRLVGSKAPLVLVDGGQPETKKQKNLQPNQPDQPTNAGLAGDLYRELLSGLRGAGKAYIAEQLGKVAWPLRIDEEIQEATAADFRRQKYLDSERAAGRPVMRRTATLVLGVEDEYAVRLAEEKLELNALEELRKIESGLSVAWVISERPPETALPPAWTLDACLKALVDIGLAAVPPPKPDRVELFWEQVKCLPPETVLRAGERFLADPFGKDSNWALAMFMSKGVYGPRVEPVGARR